MSVEDNKQVVARFVEVCQNQHDLAAADGMFHPQFVNHFFPGGRPLPATSRPAEAFQRYYGRFLAAFPDATMQIEEQIAEGDLVRSRKPRSVLRDCAKRSSTSVLVAGVYEHSSCTSGWFAYTHVHPVSGVPHESSQHPRADSPSPSL